MQSKIQKLEVSFNPIEDRLILKFHTEDLSEYRLWLTRRFTKLLWKTLNDLLHGEKKPPSQQAMEKKQITKAYEREQTMKQSEFVQKYASKVALTKTPLGPEPILVTKIQIKQPKDEAPILCLHPDDGQGFEISAHSMIIHAIRKLLCEAVSKSDWDLDMSM